MPVVRERGAARVKAGTKSGSSGESPITMMKSLAIIFLLTLISLSLCVDSETNDDSISGSGDTAVGDRSGGDGSVEDRIWRRGRYHAYDSSDRYRSSSTSSDNVWIILGTFVVMTLICCGLCGVIFCVCNRAKETHHGSVYKSQTGSAAPTAAPSAASVHGHNRRK